MYFIAFYMNGKAQHHLAILPAVVDYCLFFLSVRASISEKLQIGQKNLRVKHNNN